MRLRSRTTQIVTRTVAALALFLFTTARADDFADFRIPKHDVLSWTGNLTGSGFQSVQDGPGIRRLNGQFMGSMHSDFAHRRTDDIATTRVDFGMRFDGNRDGAHTTASNALPAFGTSSTLDGRDSRRQTAESWYLSLQQTRQIATVWYVGAGADVSGDDTRNWGNFDTHDTYVTPGHVEERFHQDDSRTRTNRISSSGSLRAGFGRVRDATGIHLALVMEERLKQRGVLVRPLSHEARQRLADLFVMADAYDRVRNRPGRGIWAEIERVLREDGALAPAGLDAPSAERARESQYPFDDTYRRIDGLPVASTTRWIGWQVGPLLRGTHARHSEFGIHHEMLRVYADGALTDFTETSVPTSGAVGQDQASLGLDGEWHRPFGPRWQVNAMGSATRPLRPQEDGFETYTYANVVWAITDRWYATGTASQSRGFRKDADTGLIGTDTWFFGMGSSLRYEIDDHLQLSVSAQELQSNASYHAPSGGPQSGYYRRSRAIGFGLTYRFAGRFFAPNFPTLSERVHSDPVL